MRRLAPWLALAAAALVTMSCDTPTAPAVLEPDAPRFGHIAGPSSSSKIAFSSNRDGDVEIYVMDADGSNPTRLTSSPGEDRMPAWSPDGTRIAFASYRDGNANIYVMDADGTNQQRLTTSGGTDYIPAWSPDGATIAFYSHGGSRGHGHTEVYTMNADGTGQTRITFGRGWKYGATWSPDGTQIAYRNDYPWPSHIEVANSDGTGTAQAITSSNWDEGPDWSSDGTTIAFHGKPSLWTPTWDIYVVNADGTGRTQLTSTPGIHEHQPKWSADRRIAYSANPAGIWDIFVMNGDGSGQANLTNAPSRDLDPDWSPELVPQDVTPPSIGFDQTVTEIWPPNHRMVTVAMVAVSDDMDPSPTVTWSVMSNEDPNGSGDGDTAPDWAVTENGDGTYTVQVRAERAGNGNGRVYEIEFSAEDASGNQSSASGSVSVPHDRGNGKQKGR